jgi:hypothetical protein
MIVDSLARPKKRYGLAFVDASIHHHGGRPPLFQRAHQEAGTVLCRQQFAVQGAARIQQHFIQ